MAYDEHLAHRIRDIPGDASGVAKDEDFTHWVNVGMDLAGASPPK